MSQKSKAKTENKVLNYLSTHFKPELNTKKDKIYLGIKIFLSLVYIGLFITVFAYKLQYIWDMTQEIPVPYFSVSRVILAVLGMVLGILMLFYRPTWSKKQEVIASFVISALSVFGIFMMTQYSIVTDVDYLVNDYSYLNMRIIFWVFNLFILGTIFLILYGIIGNFKVPIIIMALFACIASLVNYFVTLFRGTAIIAVDFTNVKTGMNVASGYEYRIHFRIVFLVMATIFIISLALKLGKNPIKFLWFRVAVILMAALCLLVGYKKLWNDNHYDKLIKVKYYRPQATYVKKGFYLGFFKSIKDTQVKPPEGYSVDAVKKLAKKYKGTPKTTKDTPNIIVMMSEAFADFSQFFDLDINKDNLQFLHSLKENTISGKLYVPVWGGGTVSTEFECLTGNSMAFVPNGITCYTTYIFDPMQSMASHFKAQGIGKAEALHPFIKEDYNRDKVYDFFGFDKFYGLTDFGVHPEIVGTYISDNENVKKLIKTYEKYRKKSTKPYFMFNVSMQNHSPYLSGSVSKDYKLSYKSDMPEANEYMNLLSHTDRSMKKLIDYFKNKDEKTIILFFGDHQPKLEDSFYSKMDESFKIPNIPHAERKRISNYYLWANYDIEEKENYDISANYLETLLADTAGLAKSGYTQFISDVMEKVPVVSIYGCVDKDGNAFSALDTKSPYYKLLNKYNIAQYNDLHDVENRVDEFFEIAQK